MASMVLNINAAPNSFVDFMIVLPIFLDVPTERLNHLSTFYPVDQNPFERQRRPWWATAALRNQKGVR
jgi:hypothetical protein